MTSPDHLLNRWLRSVGAPNAVATMAEILADLHGPDTAVFAVDRDQNVMFWSRGAESMLGFSAEEMLGQHCLKANRCKQCMVGCGVAQNGTVSGVSLVLHTRDGAELRVCKTARAFHDADGTFAGGIEVLVLERPPAAVGLPSPPAETEDPDSEAGRFHGLISADPAMRQGFQIIRNVAETDATVLIRGESGTGKELAARALHRESHRADGPFLAVNCAALSPTLLESELFGHVKGAFTGAIKDRPGLFRQADGGTLFLDEVAELPLDLQAKLLRVLQERTFTPVGGSDSIAVDLRIVAATHRALRQKVRAGEFREDLMYRLRVVPIYLPPLRERRGDVELLLRQFIHQHNERGPRRIRAIDPDVMRALLDHDWPGNVRELLNVVQYAFAVGRGPDLRISELPPEFRERGSTLPTPRAPQEDQASRIRDALARSGGHVGRAAALLGMSRPTFWRHRKKLGI